MEYYKNWDEVIANVSEFPHPERLVIACADDARALEAAQKAAAHATVAPILVGDRARIEPLAEAAGMDLTQVPVHHEPDNDKAAALAVSLIREGKADYLMKGHIESSALLKAVVSKDHGLTRGRLISHISYIEVPSYHKMIAITDGGMVVYPTLEQKKTIMDHAVNMLLTMGYNRPKVAVLAGIEKVNPKMKETVDAAALKEMNRNGEIRDCVVEGPISVDIALSKEKARQKDFVSEVAGEADILLVPDLCCGNCIAKILLEMAGGRMAGVVVGASVPIVLTSRSSSMEEKYLSIVISAAFSARKIKNLE